MKQFSKDMLKLTQVFGVICGKAPQVAFNFNVKSSRGK